MAQSATDQLEELRDTLADLELRIATLEKAAEKAPSGSEDKGLRAEFDALKAQLQARFGHSLE